MKYLHLENYRLATLALFHSLSWSPQGPEVVRVVELVACDLLLVAGATPVRVLQRVGVVMRVEPAGEVRLTETKVRAIAKYWTERERGRKRERERERERDVFVINSSFGDSNN